MTILDRIASHLSSRADEVVYTCLESSIQPERLSYAQLDRRARALAAHIQDHAEPGDRALMLYPHGLEFITSFLACLYAGVIAVPAYPPRRNRSIDRLHAIAADCRPTLILTVAELEPDLERDFLTRHGIACCLATDEESSESIAPCTLPRPTADQLAFIQYTSGSTGTPKGTMVTHGNLVSNEQTIQTAFRYSHETIMVSWLPLFHDMGLIGGVLQPLFTGFPSVLLAPNLFLREPIRWLRAISDYRGTTTGAPNFAYDHCVDLVSESDKSTIDLCSLSLAYNGAEPVRATTLDRFAKAFACCGFNRKAFFPCYGMAETTLFTAGGPPQRDPITLTVDSRALESHRVIPACDDGAELRTFVGCGAVGEGTRVVVVDPETCRESATGEIGEIWIAGPSVAVGYWNQSKETQKSFHALMADHPNEPFLRTGDLGFLLDRELFITGRLKDIIIVRGRNIYPQDIEAVVERVVDFVKPNTCAAFAIESDSAEGLGILIEANRELTRKIRKESGNCDAASSPNNCLSQTSNVAAVDHLVCRIREVVAETFEIAPVRISFVQPGAFPRTSSGKVQRHACREGIDRGTLDLVYDWSGRRNGKPWPSAIPDSVALSRVERLTRDLVGIVNHWIRAQPDMPHQTIASDTDLRSLGMDSMAITSLALEIENHLRIRVSENILYDSKTLNALVPFLVECEPIRENCDLVAGAKSPSPCDSMNDGPVGNVRSNGNHHAEFAADIMGQIKRTLRTLDALPPDAPPPNKRVRFADPIGSRNRRQDEWRRNGNYFFATEIENQSEGWVHVDGRKLLMMASYSYLGLIGHDMVNEAAIAAIRKYGTGAHGVRLLAGTMTEHCLLERELAEFMNAEAAIVYNTGFMTNLSTIAALVDEGDLVVGDELNHASIVDGCRFSHANFIAFRHNDVAHLEQILKKTPARRKLVVVDAVYSMEGDIAKLPAIVDICKNQQAMLMVDEAHSIGVLGKNGRGIQEHFDLPADAIDLKMGTLSKTIASCGGFIAASAEIIDYLKHQARGFIFSCALPAAQTAAARKCLEILQSEPWRVERLRRNVARLVAGLHALGFHVASTESAIVPIVFESEETTLAMVKLCREQALFVVPVFYPAVPLNAPRIRASVTASHTDDDIDFALAIFQRAARQIEPHARQKPHADPTRSRISL